MARKSGWQEFAENFNATFEIGNKIQQGIATNKVMDDEKFMAEGAAGYGLSGNELEKARYKALGDIYTKYGDPEKGLGFRTQLADLEDRELRNLEAKNTSEFRQEVMGILARNQAAANVNNTLADTSLTNANATRVTGLTDAEIKKAQLTNEKLGFDLSRGKALLPGELTRQGLDNTSVELGNTNRGILNDTAIFELNKGQSMLEGDLTGQRLGLEAQKLANLSKNIENNQANFNLSADKQKLPAQLKQLDATIKSTLESANLNATSANRINALLNGEIALNAANVNSVIAGTGLKGAQAEELRALLAGKIELQGLNAEAKRVEIADNKLKYDIAYNTADGQVSAMNAQYANQIAEARASGSAAQLEQLSTDAFSDFAINQKNGMYKTDKESTDAYMEIVKMFDPAKAADLAQKYNENEIQKIATDGALYQAEVSAFVQKGDLEGIRSFFDDQNGTATGVKLDSGEDGSYRMYEVDDDGNQVSLIMEAPDKTEALSRLEQLTTYGNAANFSEKLFARRKDEAAMKNTEANTEFTLENLKSLSGRRDLTEAQAKQANATAQKIRSELRRLNDGTTAGLAKDAADQKAVDQFIREVTIASLLDPESIDVPTLVANFMKNRAAPSQEISFIEED